MPQPWQKPGWLLYVHSHRRWGTSYANECPMCSFLRSGVMLLRRAALHVSGIPLDCRLCLAALQPKDISQFRTLPFLPFSTTQFCRQKRKKGTISSLPSPHCSLLTWMAVIQCGSCNSPSTNQLSWSHIWLGGRRTDNGEDPWSKDPRPNPSHYLIRLSSQWINIPTGIFSCSLMGTYSRFLILVPNKVLGVWKLSLLGVFCPFINKTKDLNSHRRNHFANMFLSLYAFLLAVTVPHGYCDLKPKERLQCFTHTSFMRGHIPSWALQP